MNKFKYSIYIQVELIFWGRGAGEEGWLLSLNVFVYIPSIYLRAY